MSLKERVQNDLKQAFKRKEEDVLRTLKMLSAEIHNAEIAKRPDALTEEDVQAVIKRAAKKRRQAIEIYEKAKRAELARREAEELAVLERYLPETQ